MYLSYELTIQISNLPNERTFVYRRLTSTVCSRMIKYPEGANGNRAAPPRRAHNLPTIVYINSSSNTENFYSVNILEKNQAQWRAQWKFIVRVRCKVHPSISSCCHLVVTFGNNRSGNTTNQWSLFFSLSQQGILFPCIYYLLSMYLCKIFRGGGGYRGNICNHIAYIKDYLQFLLV